MSITAKEIGGIIKDVPDFPKKGIIFKDITPLLSDYQHYSAAIRLIVDRVKNRNIAKVLGIESRGFLLAAPVALAIGAGFVPVRKKGKLPRKTVNAIYSLEYGTDMLEMHEDAISNGEKVLIVDDVLATGGTCAAVCQMVKNLGGDISGAEFLIELGFLNGRDKLKGVEVNSIVRY